MHEQDTLHLHQPAKKVVIKLSYEALPQRQLNEIMHLLDTTVADEIEVVVEDLQVSV